MLLEMTRSEHPTRVAVGPTEGGLTFDRLSFLSRSAARMLRENDANSMVFIGTNSDSWPVALYAGAIAGIPVVPLNYRFADASLRSLLDQLDRPFVVADARYFEAVAPATDSVVETSAWLAEAEQHVDISETDSPWNHADGDAPAVILFTSGTTSSPKGVILRHSHLVSYVVGTVDFGSAEQADAALVSVPPYHVAGVGTVLTNTYAGRRIVYLPQFEPADWLGMVRQERISQAMLVPTMLARIVGHLGHRVAHTPSLRQISYGGSAMPKRVLERAMAAFPDCDFVNSYGLTETSSTIAVLGPDDHRRSLAASDPAVKRRLISVGKPIPGVEASIRDGDGLEVAPGVVGELYLRGSQISGEYLNAAAQIDPNGWFRTRDRAEVDADGYLFVFGRTDDTIIRGGENIAPDEIESVIRLHPEVEDVGVAGVPDDEWGERILAVVVREQRSELGSDELRAWVRERVRGSRTPDDVIFADALPYNSLGKLVRRDLVHSSRSIVEEEEMT